MDDFSFSVAHGDELLGLKLYQYGWLEFDGLRAAGYLSAAGLGVAQPLYQPNSAALATELRDTMLYIASHPKTSTLHQIGHLCLFLDTLIRSSSTRRKPRGSQLRDFYIQENDLGFHWRHRRLLRLSQPAPFFQIVQTALRHLPPEWRSQNKLYEVK